MRRRSPRLPLGLAVALVLVGAFVFGPSASAIQPECKAINQTQDVAYHSNHDSDPLGAAISEADSGDTIKVIGTCYGNFVIDKDLTLIGRPSEQQADTIDGGSSGGVLSVPSAVSGVDLTVMDLTVTGGTSGVSMYYDGILTLVRTTVTGVTGTGVANWGSSTVLIEDSTITENTARGVYNSTGSMTIRNTVISDNEMTGDGGGIFNRGTLTVERTIVSDNQATSYGNGGGIFNVGGLTITSSTIDGNSAHYGGGGIFSNTWLGVSVENSEITGNTGSGGGVRHDGTGIMTLTDSLVDGNIGEGIKIYGSGPVTLTRTTVSNNTSGNGGGIWAYYTAGTLTLNESYVTGNTGTYGAGGIYVSGVMNVTNSVVSGNTGPDGGGIYIYAYPGYGIGTVTLSNSDVSGNAATRGGGVWMMADGWLTLNNSTVTSNDASVEGGGIYVYGGSSGHVIVTGTSTVCGNSPDDWPGCAG